MSSTEIQVVGHIHMQLRRNFQNQYHRICNACKYESRTIFEFKFISNLGLKYDCCFSLNSVMRNASTQPLSLPPQKCPHIQLAYRKFVNQSQRPTRRATRNPRQSRSSLALLINQKSVFPLVTIVNCAVAYTSLSFQRKIDLTLRISLTEVIPDLTWRYIAS